MEREWRQKWRENGERMEREWKENGERVEKERREGGERVERGWLVKVEGVRRDTGCWMWRMGGGRRMGGGSADTSPRR